MYQVCVCCCACSCVQNRIEYYIFVAVVVHADCIFPFACAHTFQLKHLKITSGQLRNAHMQRSYATKHVYVCVCSHKFANKLHCKQL